MASVEGMQEMGRGIGWREVACVLRDQMLNGTLPPGTALLSETDLAVVFACGRDTVRDALAVLNSEGHILKRRGRLTIVRPAPNRAVVPLPAGALLTARPITAPETERLQCDPGVAILEVRTSDGHSLYRSDQYAFTSTD